MELYFEIFGLTLFLSTLFAMGGVGSAVALIPILHFLGLPFNSAKATGLFVNTLTTSTATFMNWRRGVLKIGEALPLALSMGIGAPVGAYLSTIIPEIVPKFLFLLLLFFSGSMLLFGGVKEPKFHLTHPGVMVALGGVVGVLSGILGIGGGSLLLPILGLLGFDPKRLAVLVSFVVPFSTLTGFLTYISLVPIDWGILGVSGVGAVLGGYIGNYLMHFYLSRDQLRKLIGILLYLIGAKLLFSLL
ncbi:MAG: sulfite exporter TauE/SafE family protein [Campylobacterales bacterium]